MPKRNLSFSGGGHNTHSLLAGFFAGALDRLEAMGSRSGLVDLMRNVEGISALSGGSWFLSHLAYSAIFNSRFDSTADRNGYTADSGYIGALQAVVDQVQSLEAAPIPEEIKTLPTGLRALHDAIEESLNELRNDSDAQEENRLPATLQGLINTLGTALSTGEISISQEIEEVLSQFQQQVLAYVSGNADIDAFLAAGATLTDLLDGLIQGTEDTLEYLGFLGKLIKFIGADAERDWRRVVDGLVYAPLGINAELRNLTLNSPRLPWAADKDLIIASALGTSPSVLVAQPVAGLPAVYDRIFAKASGDPAPSGVLGDIAHARPISISSLVNAGGSFRASVDIPGKPLRAPRKIKMLLDFVAARRII